MKRLRISIENKKSPFSIASSRAVGNIQESLDFIPGTTIRGAFAGSWLKENVVDSNFKEIFTGDRVVFSNFYIQDAKPIPLTALSCKYHAGLKEEKDKHGIEDILIPFIKAGRIPDELECCQYLREGKPCNAPLKKIRGYYLEDISSGSLEPVRIEKRLIYRTAISPISETALEGALFSQEVIEAGQNFIGDIWVYDDALLSKIEGFIKKLPSFYIGADKSAGFGRCEILYSEISDVIDKQELQRRISDFNEKLGINKEKTYFSITLQSEAIIMDEFMRYKTFIEPGDLGLPEAEFVYGIADSRLLQGWNAMTKLPKEDAIAVEKGSVFVFEVNNLDSVLKRLHETETKGIGKRRGEGFGRLVVCDSFHLMGGLR